jgi:hypothetical protein
LGLGQKGPIETLAEMFAASDIDASGAGMPFGDLPIPIEKQQPIRIAIGEKPKKIFGK